MRLHRFSFASTVLLGGTAITLGATTPCNSPEAAKAVAEGETLGEAVTAHRTHRHHHAGFPPWEVLVHMPHGTEGWRLVIAWDDGKVLKKERIPNPPSKVR